MAFLSLFVGVVCFVCELVLETLGKNISCFINSANRQANVFNIRLGLKMMVL